MNVEVVDRNSDDFEPFDKVISQADARTPPRVQGRKKKQIQLSPIDDDTNGEISMDLDDSKSFIGLLQKVHAEQWTGMDPYESPMAYYSNQRVSAAPNSVRRVGSTSRPVRHSPDTDYDRLPSPRAASSRRQSRASVKSAGPSRLSQSFVAAHDESDIPGGSGSEEDDEGVGFVPELSLPPDSPEHPSFSQLDQEEDEEEEDQIENAILSPQRSVAKSGRKSRRAGDDEEEEMSRRSESKKGKKSRVEEDEEVEEEIAQAMDEVDMEDPEDDPVPPRHLSDIAEEPEDDQQPQYEEEEQEEEPKSVKKTKKSRKHDSENADSQPPSKKPRTVSIAAKGGRGRRTPLADKTPEPHVVRLRSGKPPLHYRSIF